MLKKLCAISMLGVVMTFTACESLPTTSSNIKMANLVQLQNHTWVATHIGNTEIKTSENTRMPSLQFNADTQRITGTDGCNRLMGSYEAGRDTLVLSPLASTKMACVNNSHTAQQFNEAMAKVANYQVFSQTLKLLDRHGNVLIQFTHPVQAP